ncbi:MAG: penicillin-binding transpeptidase domain-containing protein [Planctomycetaceae bacterium]
MPSVLTHHGMQNRPSLLLDQTLSRSSESATGARTDLRLVTRLLIVGLGIVVPLVVIGWRIAGVQLLLTSDYSEEFLATTERVESIPTRDGRILSADGQVLAEDELSYSLQVHYRWLEEPPDPGWLKAQALRKLDRSGRRDPRRIAQALTEVEATRQRLWSDLARATGLSADELSRRRRAIQLRIERRYEQVNQRRLRDAAPPPNSDSEQAGWEGWWRLVVRTLTTPPRREAQEPLVLAEQLDYHPLVDDLPYETAVEIEGHPEQFPGGRIRGRPRRVYPSGELAAHVVGWRGPVSDDFLRERRKRFPETDPLDYQPGDRVGVSGLERYYEHQLRGLRGERRLTVDRRGEILSERISRSPRYGADVVVGLSLDLQQRAEQLLDAALVQRKTDATTGRALPQPTGGAIVALDVRTGQVLAAASAPRFDPRVLTDGNAAAWRAIQADPRRPLFHRATEATLPPGSVFKIVSAVALLQEGFIDPGESLTCLGYLDSPERYRCYTFKHHGVGHGEVNLVSALARSCNVFFFDAARRSGSQPLLDWADRLGLGRTTGIDLPGEKPGSLPPAAATQRSNRADGEALQLAIGQGRLTVTPLQMARLLGTVANGGVMINPRVVSRVGVVGPQGREIDSYLETQGEAVPELTAGTLQLVRKGLWDVVASPAGTGHKSVYWSQVAIAGKTGTAESGGGRPDHAWFAGYAPANRPRVAFVVVLEHAGTGGTAAGPVARGLVEALAELQLLGGETHPPESPAAAAN